MSRPDLPALPTEIYADPGHRNWYFREKKPDSVARYIRADLARPMLTQALELPEVAALVEAAKVIADRNKFANPMRSADMHKGNCQCARCHYDALDAALDALTTAPVDGDKP